MILAAPLTASAMHSLDTIDRRSNLADHHVRRIGGEMFAKTP